MGGNVKIGNNDGLILMGIDKIKRVIERGRKPQSKSIATTISN